MQLFLWFQIKNILCLYQFSCHGLNSLPIQVMKSITFSAWCMQPLDFSSWLVKYYYLILMIINIFLIYWFLIGFESTLLIHSFYIVSELKICEYYCSEIGNFEGYYKTPKAQTKLIQLCAKRYGEIKEYYNIIIFEIINH